MTETHKADSSRTPPGTRASVLTPPVSERDHAQGPADAAITLVEYGDYQDRKCADAQPQIKALQAHLGDRLRLVFRHFPATGLYPHAAEAAEAAGLQDRFWEMHDTLFAHHTALGNGHLVEYAHSLGLDVNQFLRDMTGHISAEHLRADRVSGARSGVRKTPTYFINNVLQTDPWDVSLAFMAAIPPGDTDEISRWADDGAPPARNAAIGDNGTGGG